MKSITWRGWAWQALAAGALSLGLGACGGNGGDAPPATPPAGYTLALEPPALTVGQGREAWLSVSVQRDAGFDGDIQVALNQPPAGVTAGTLVLAVGIDSGPLPIHLAAELAVGTVLALDVQASSGSVSRSATSMLTVSAPQPYAQQAIAAALRAGSIDFGTSLLYRAYALFGDARLPDAYLGAGSVEEDNLLFEQIRLRLAQFTPERQAELRAFIVRPTDSLSVWNRGPTAGSSGQTSRVMAASGREQAAQTTAGRLALPPESCASLADGAWVSKRSTLYAVRVWMQCGPAPVTDAVVQRVIAGTLEVLDSVYVPMTQMLGPPRSDLEGGGDNAIDIYIVHDSGSVHRRNKDFTPSGLGVTYNEPPFVGEKASAFVLIPRSTLVLPQAHTTTIHEFFHVLQNAHNAFLYGPTGCVDEACKWHWFVEASATWAGAYFDRTTWTGSRAAFDHAYDRFAETFQPSDAALNATDDDGSQHDRSAFIWPYFVEQETKGTAFMTQIWNGLGGATTFAAADDVINGAYSFALNFPRFAVRNLNHEFKPGGPLPEIDRHVSLDAAQFKDADNKEPPYLPGNLVAESAYSQPLALANLSARYVKLSVQGTTIRKVEIDTGGLTPGGSLITQALIETDDGWVAKPVELVHGKTVFCFDAGPSTETLRGSFKEIVLVLSNHALRKDDKISGELKALPTATPCATLWEGSIKQVARDVTDVGTITIATYVNAVFEFDDTAHAQSGEIPFRLKSGSWTIDARTEVTGRNPPCRGFTVGSGALPLLPFLPLVPSGTSAGLRTFPDAFQYAGGGVSVVAVTSTDNCNDRNVDMTTVGAYMLFWWSDATIGEISADGNSIRRAYTAANGVEYEISLDKVRDGR